MKKYVTLIITALLISTAYSQVSTGKSSESQDTVVCLPKSVAKEIVKDLYRKDSLQNELSIVKETYRLLQESYSLKDSLISNKTSIINIYKERENNLNSVISLKDKQIKEYMDLSSSYKSKIDRSNKTKAFNWGVTIASFLLAVGVTIF